ncbi:hypothetical protein ACFVZD_12600 [Streptomyces sp. NPDC058287]|uniref:hypothetical protein n=1 Tax=Streptomyces sp. NPDC058287 TaxID=3346423 RepID=UPI0036EFFFAF
MKVTAYRVFGRRNILREAQHAAPSAADLVAHNVRGRLPRVEIVLTTPQGIGELTTRANSSLVPDASPQAVDKNRRILVRKARSVFGLTTATRNGVLILLNVHKLPHSDLLAVTLVHELVHAMQFSRPGVMERHLDRVRHNLDIAPLSRRELRSLDRHMNAAEDEAYRMESALTPQLNACAA